MRQVGKSLGILAQFEAKEIILHMDVDAFYAPSECHGLVSKNESKRARQARRHAKSVSGLSNTQFRKELHKWRNAPFIRLTVSRIVDRTNPFGRGF